MEAFTIIFGLLYIGICIGLIVKFFELCSDTRKIKELLESRLSNNSVGVHKPTVENDTRSVSTNSTPDVVGSNDAKPIGAESYDASKVRIGSFGICTFIGEKPAGKFNFITENGQNITLNAKDAEKFVRPL